VAKNSFGTRRTLRDVLKMVRVRGAVGAPGASHQGHDEGCCASQVVMRLLQDRQRQRACSGLAQGRHPAGARKTIGIDIKTVQATWPIDKPLVDSLGHGLREVRSTHDKVEYRVIFALNESTMVLLHGFVKTTKKTRKSDIDIGLERKAIREKVR